MSQCSGRVKHALSPPFVSSGLLLSPVPAGKDGWPAFAKSRLRKRERHGRKTLANRGRRTARPTPALHTRPCLFLREKRTTFMRLHDIIYRPSRLIVLRERRAPDRIPESDDLCTLPGLPFPASNSAEPHGLVMADAGDFTKSTQIGHKLCRNRRNWGHLPACIALRA
jgi:hypothetical protein